MAQSRARYVILALLAWLAGPAVALYLLLVPAWTCSGDGGCEQAGTEWCWLLYLVVALGPGLLATVAAILAWRRARSTAPDQGA